MPSTSSSQLVIADGTYGVRGELLYIIPDTLLDQAILERAASTFRAIKRKKYTPSAARKRIKRDLPELQTWADVLPKTRGELYVVAGILAGFLAAMIPVALDYRAGKYDRPPQKEVPKRVQPFIDATPPASRLGSHTPPKLPPKGLGPAP